MVARKEVLEWDPLPMTPETLSWSAYARSADKIVNTPNVASIYTTNLQVKHMLEIGGLEYFEFMASLKSQLMYDLIDESEGFVGEACGEFGCGLAICNAEGNATECVGDSEPNACGGCFDLPPTREPGEICSN